MKKNLLRFGLLSLLLVFAFIAKAQDVTAIWDFHTTCQKESTQQQIFKVKWETSPLQLTAFYYM